MIVYCATTNPGKLAEFRRESHDRIVIDALPDLSAVPVAEETGQTFAENAILKALHYSRYTREFVFADDSGLEVDALDGAPGVYSARYAGPEAGDRANNALLLERMAGVVDRSARFVCVIALARKGELVRTFRGEVAGRILDETRGSGGFGYDPLFYYPPFGCSFGEIDAERKQQVSHRGQALRAMLEFLERLAGEQA